MNRLIGEEGVSLTRIMSFPSSVVWWICSLRLHSFLFLAMAQPTPAMIVRLPNLQYVLFKDTEDDYASCLLQFSWASVQAQTLFVCLEHSPLAPAAPPLVQHAAAKVEFANLINTPVCCECLIPRPDPGLSKRGGSRTPIPVLVPAFETWEHSVAPLPSV